MRSNFSRLISNWQTSSTKCLVPRSKCQNNNQFEPLKHAVFYLRTLLLLYESRQQCQLFTTISVLSTFSLLHFPLLLISISFFLFRGGRAISFQNNLFHHLTMKSKIGYRSLVMTIILTVIFSKKELLIKRKKKKKVKVILKILIIGKLRLLEIIITDGKVYLFIYLL